MWGAWRPAIATPTETVQPDQLAVVPPPNQDPPCSCYHRHWTDGSWRADLDPYCLTHGVITSGDPCPMYGCLRFLGHLGSHAVVTV